MLKLFPSISEVSTTPLESLVYINTGSGNLRIYNVADASTPDYVYPTSFTLTSFTNPYSTVHCSNSTPYDITVSLRYIYSYMDDDGSWHYNQIASYSTTFAANSSFDDNGFSISFPLSTYQIESKSLTLTITGPFSVLTTKVNKGVYAG